jgi:hypothetical protein
MLFLSGHEKHRAQGALLQKQEQNQRLVARGSHRFRFPTTRVGNCNPTFTASNTSRVS